MFPRKNNDCGEVIAVKIKGKTEYVALVAGKEVYRGPAFLRALALALAQEAAEDDPGCSIIINKETHGVAVENMFSSEKE